jgi:hypothetical protein
MFGSVPREALRDELDVRISLIETHVVLTELFHGWEGGGGHEARVVALEANAATAVAGARRENDAVPADEANEKDGV